MLFSRLICSALVLLSELELSSAKAVFYDTPSTLDRRANVNDILEREPLPQQSSAPVVADTDVGAACAQAISAMDSQANPAGVVACYDITEWQPQTGSFVSEVRIYQTSQSSGAFQGIDIRTALVTLQYPAAAIASLSRRMRRATSTASSSTLTPISSTSYTGRITSSLQLNKLNNTEIIALLVPTIAIEAVSTSNTPVAMNLTTSDIAFFPVGPFSRTQHSTLAAVLSNPSGIATQAIADSSVFTLPGTTLGIFPTGLIVTGSWCILFLGAFGYGTLGRINHQKQFRRRIANPRFGSR